MLCSLVVITHGVLGGQAHCQLLVPKPEWCESQRRLAIWRTRGWVWEYESMKAMYDYESTRVWVEIELCTWLGWDGSMPVVVLWSSSHYVPPGCSASDAAPRPDHSGAGPPLAWFPTSPPPTQTSPLLPKSVCQSLGLVTLLPVSSIHWTEDW